MEDQPKLSKNFNNKLYTEVRRKIFLRNIFSIVTTGFFKGVISFVDAILSLGKTNFKKENK